MSAAIEDPSLAPPDVLLQDFESLGSNCEFGLMQRHFGMERPGLLRWGHIQPEFQGLLNFLAQRGVGVGEHVSLHTHETEYISRDEVYRLTFHTERYVGTITPEKLIETEKRRIQFMTASLFEMIEEGEVMFVFKADTISDYPHIRLLRDVIHSIGPAPVLFVTLPRDPALAGKVESMGNGLYWGYLDRFSPPEAIPSYCSFDLWLEVCRKARRLWHLETLAKRQKAVHPPVVERAVAPVRQGSFWRRVLGR